MKTQFKPNQSPRIIIIQKLYGNFFNEDKNLIFTKHRFKKFIKDVVLGTIERDEVIREEVKNHLSNDFQLTNLDKVFQVIIKSAIFEFLYKPKISTKIIIKEMPIRPKRATIKNCLSLTPATNKTPKTDIKITAEDPKSG